MDFGYNQVQAANLAPYLELMMKQQQQPMIDALNRQKLQEGMLNMGSLEYKARKDAQDESDKVNAIKALQASVVEKPSLNNKFYDDNGKPITVDTPGMQLRKGFDKSAYMLKALEMGIDPKNAAEYAKATYEASGMNTEEKQGNVLETLLAKQMSDSNKSDLAQEKLIAQITKANDPYKAAEEVTGRVTDGLFDNDTEDAKAIIAEALLPYKGDPEKFAAIQQLALDSIQKPAEGTDYALAALDVAGLASIPFTGGTGVAAKEGIKAVLLNALKNKLETKGGKATLAALGLGGLAELDRSNYASVLTGDTDFNSKAFKEKLVTLLNTPAVK